MDNSDNKVENISPHKRRSFRKRKNKRRVLCVVIAVIIGLIVAGVATVCAVSSDAEQPIAKTEKPEKPERKKKKKARKKAAELPPQQQDNIMAASLRKCAYATAARPNFQADYFVFLRCSEWCVYCQRFRPVAFNAAREMMKDNRVTFIYVSSDYSRESAKELFYTKYKARDIPVIMESDLPGNPAHPPFFGLPFVHVMDKYGRVVVDGTQDIQNWRRYTIDKGTPKPLAGSEQTGIKLIPAALKKCAFFTKSQPNLNAEYYILLHTAYFCSACQEKMPETVRQYNEMRKDGRVELVMLAGEVDPSTDVTYNWLSTVGARFPATKVSSFPKIIDFPKDVEDTFYRVTPCAVLVKADGTYIAHDMNWIRPKYRNIIKDWKKIITEAGASSPQEAEQDTVSFRQKLEKLHTINGKKINTEADYYVLMTTGSYECTFKYDEDCKNNESEFPEQGHALVQSFMKALAESYNDRQDAGKKVELILVAIDRKPETLQPYLSESGAQFPVILQSDKNLAEIEDYIEPTSDIGCVVLDKDGYLIHSQTAKFEKHDPEDYWSERYMEFILEGDPACLDE